MGACLHQGIEAQNKTGPNAGVRMWQPAFLYHPACVRACLRRTQICDFHVSWHHHINRIKINACWLPWWCCYDDQSKEEVSWWVAVYSDSLLPKMCMMMLERDENKLRGSSYRWEENIKIVFEDESCLVSAQLIMRLKHAKNELQ